MIIGISGKKQSGKDFAAKIFYRYLRSAFVPASTFTTFEEKIFNDLEKQPMPIYEIDEIEVVRFADPVKDIVCLLIGCTREQLEDPEFKDKPLSIDWGTVDISTQEIEGHSVNLMRYELLTPRRMLQKIGTDAIRNHLHTNTWVNVFLRKYEEAKSKNHWMIVPDVRFLNEYDAIKKEMGLLIRVEKEGLDSKDNHPSEVSLDEQEFDHHILWNSPEDLFNQVKQILILENLV